MGGEDQPPLTDPMPHAGALPTPGPNSGSCQGYEHIGGNRLGVHLLV